MWACDDTPPNEGGDARPSDAIVDASDMGDMSISDAGDMAVPDMGDAAVADMGDGAVADMGDAAVADMGDGAVPDMGDAAMADMAVPDMGDAAVPDAAIDMQVLVPLTIALDAPADGLVTAATPVTVEGHLSRAATVTINGAEAAVDDALRFSLPVALEEGANELIAVAVAGEDRAETSVEVTLDSTAPALTIDAPADGSATNQPNIDVNGTIDDPAATLTLNDAPVAHADGVWSVPGFVLQEGENVLLAVAVDALGNRAEVSVTVTFDPNAPDLAISNEDGVVQRDGAVVVTGTAAGNGVTVTVAGQPAPLDADGAFEVALQLEEGEHEIVIEATSAGGSVTRAVLHVTIDATAPELAITSPAPGAQLIQRSIEVTGTLNEAGTVRIGAGEAVLAAAGAWTIAEVALVEGDNIIQVTATDRAGNETQAQVAVEVDSTAPTIEITEPADGLVLRDGQIDVAGAALGADLVSVEINGVVVEVAADGSFALPAFGLEEGRNNITAIATDAFGNVGLARVVVFRDTVAPMLRIETPTDGEVLTSTQIDVAGLCNDLVAGVTVGEEDVRIWINGQEAQVLNRTFVLPDLLLQRGANVIQVEAVDRAGNRANRTINVTVDPQAGQRVVLISGNSQRVEPGEALAAPLVVSLLSANGDPVPETLVVFEVSRGDGELAAFPDSGRVLAVMTDENGLANVGFVPGGRSGAGSHRVIAHAPGFVGRVEFCHSVLSGDADRITTVEGEVQTGAAGAPLADQFLALVVDDEGNVVRNEVVTFRTVQGDATFGGEPSIDVQTDQDGLARATATLGAAGKHVFAATFEGYEGEPATFRATAVAPGAREATRVAGRVLDGQDNPLPGVTAWIRLPAGPVVAAVTDANGEFVINRAPVGPIHLVVDGGTTSRVDGAWPSIEFNMVTVAGELNRRNRDIYLPRMDMDGLVEVGGDQDVTLQLAGLPGAEMTVFGGSTTCPDDAERCTVTWSQVRAERVPDAPPMGSNFSMVWTTQPSGIRFNPPARICLPNPGHAVGHQMEIFSFDHDLSTWVGLGTATVGEDGLRACTDEGFGLFKTGWGGAPPPPPPPKCPSSCATDNPCKSGSCEDGACVYEDTNEGGRCDDHTGCGEATCQAGSCVFDSKADDGQACDDRNACTEEDECFDGACVGHDLECDDGNECTEDECDPATGCVEWPQDGTDCTPEAGGDQCRTYECIAGACIDNVIECEQDENECTESACDPDTGACADENINELGSCGNGGNDAEQCGQYICEEGACVPDDDQQSTEDQECDDEDECTEDDDCTAGECKGDPRDLEKVEGGVQLNLSQGIGAIKRNIEQGASRIPGIIVSFGSGLAVKVSAFKEDCCTEDSGFIRFGKKSGGGEIALSATVTGPVGPLGVVFNQEVNAGDSSVSIDVQLGLIASLGFTVKGAVNSVQDQCAGEEECVEAQGTLMLTGGLALKASVNGCVEIGLFGGVDVCGGMTVQPAAIVFTVSGQGLYNSCSGQYTGSVTLGQIKGVMEVDYLIGVFVLEHVFYAGAQ
jgi:hypothetical protein